MLYCYATIHETTELEKEDIETFQNSGMARNLGNKACKAWRSQPNIKRKQINLNHFDTEKKIQFRDNVQTRQNM